MQSTNVCLILHKACLSNSPVQVYHSASARPDSFPAEMAMSRKARYGLDELGQPTSGEWHSLNRNALRLMCYQLLSANLEDADPAVYDILQKVGVLSEQRPRKFAILTQTPTIGEEAAETFHQPHTLREFHLTICT